MKNYNFALERPILKAETFCFPWSQVQSVPYVSYNLYAVFQMFSLGQSRVTFMKFAYNYMYFISIVLSSVEISN